MEKTAAELFTEEDEVTKELNQAHENLDDVQREIINLRNEIDKLRAEIRNKEAETMDWKKIIRVKKQLKDEKHHQAWAARHSGL